ENQWQFGKPVSTLCQPFGVRRKYWSPPAAQLTAQCPAEYTTATVWASLKPTADSETYPEESGYFCRNCFHPSTRPGLNISSSSTLLIVLLLPSTFDRSHTCSFTS